MSAPVKLPSSAIICYWPLAWLAPRKRSTLGESEIVNALAVGGCDSDCSLFVMFQTRPGRDSVGGYREFQLGQVLVLRALQSGSRNPAERSQFEELWGIIDLPCRNPFSPSPLYSSLLGRAEPMANQRDYRALLIAGLLVSTIDQKTSRSPLAVCSFGHPRRLSFSCALNVRLRWVFSKFVYS